MQQHLVPRRWCRAIFDTAAHPDLLPSLFAFKELAAYSMTAQTPKTSNSIRLRSALPCLADVRCTRGELPLSALFLVGCPRSRAHFPVVRYGPSAKGPVRNLLRTGADFVAMGFTPTGRSHPLPEPRLRRFHRRGRRQRFHHRPGRRRSRP